MNRRFWMVCFALLVMIASLAGCAARQEVQVGENLLVNGKFDGAVEDGYPEGWRLVCYVYDDSVTAHGVDGSAGAHLVNYAPNDARFVQSVAVQKNTIYKVSALVRANITEGSGYGAGLSIEGTFIASKQVVNSGETYTTVELYVNSDSQTQLGIELRLGFFGGDAAGEAWFRDVRVEAVSAAPANAVVYPYESIPKSNASTADPASIEGKYTSQIMLIAVLIALFGLWMYARFSPERPKIERMKHTALYWLGGLVAAAFLLRVVIAMAIPGYGVDIGCFTAWSERMASVGPVQFFADADYFCDYPPGYLYVLWLIGGLRRLFGLETGTSAYYLLLKLVPIVCDLFAGVIVYKIARKYLGEKSSLLCAAAYLLNPVTLVNSAAWGQVDGVLALLLLVSVWYMVEKRMFRASIVFCVAVLVKPQAVMAGPLLLFAFIDEIREYGRQGVKTLVVSFLSCAVLFFAVSAPFMIAHGPLFIFEKYLNTIGSYQYATVNAFNLFALFGANWVDQTEILFLFSYQTWGTILMVLVFIGCTLLYFRSGQRRALPLVGALFFAGIFVLGVRMHERYMFPAFILLLLAFILYRDKRLLLIFTTFSMAHFVNVATVLNNAHVRAEDELQMIIFTVINLATFVYFCYVTYDLCVKKRMMRFFPAGKDEARPLPTANTLLEAPGRTSRMTRRDAILLAAVTLAYSVLAFINLGDTQAPITTYKSSAGGEAAVFDFGRPVQISKFTYYGGIGMGDFDLEISNDGENWQIATIADSATYTKDAHIEYAVNTMFMWHDYEVVNGTCRYARIVFSKAGIPIIEVGFFGPDGQLANPVAVAQTGHAQDRAYDPTLLCDEQGMVPARSSYMNSMYFDEIYHARTAYEHVEGLQWYETTHPPLGKALMSICIMIFGMTPFAWRLAGTLAGILMLPGMYLFGKRMFKSTYLAFAATLLLAVDCMHFAQTRIATIDSFSVLFVIWMFYFMYRYSQTNFNTQPLHKTLWPLLWSGVMMGLGIASKWTGMYAGAGLAVSFFWILWRRAREVLDAKALLRGRDVSADERGRLETMVRAFPKKLILTLAFCILAFLVIPAAIYMASYTQYFMIKGGKTFSDWWEAQKYMLDYHANLVDSHPYASPWWQWPLMIRPMWFYKGNHDGVISTINTMGNPLIWWTGFAAIVWLIVRKLRGKDHSTSATFLLIGIAAQFLPWVFVPRTMFIYHYFGSVPFLILIMCYYAQHATRNMDAQRLNKAKKWGLAFLIVAVLVFAFFYPAVSGADMPIWYARLLKWLPSWTIWAL